MSSPSLTNVEIDAISRREVPPAYAIALASRSKLCQHGPIGVRRYYGMHLVGAMFPIFTAILLFGWRSLLTLGILLVSSIFAMWVWRHIAARGRQINIADGIWKVLLLWLMLPAHLASFSPSDGNGPLWPILVGAGFLLAILLWVLGGLGSGRVHPVVVAYLLLTVVYQQTLMPHWVLQKYNLFFGDLLNGPAAVTGGMANEAWFDRTQMSNFESIRSEPASQGLIDYTRGIQAPDRALTSLESLLRDRMPPLEDLIVAGAPAPIGLGSAVAVLIGGLFLIYRGLIDFRIPLVSFFVAYLSFLILPVPVVIKGETPHWRWFAILTKDVNWSTGLTFVNYEIMAGPMLFMCFFLATAPAVRPMAHRGKVIYAVLLGFLVAIFQLYHSVSYGPYVAMLLASMITPTLDRLFPPKPLV